MSYDNHSTQLIHPVSTKCIWQNIQLGREINMIFNGDEFNRDKFEMFNFGKNTRGYKCVGFGNEIFDKHITSNVAKGIGW